MSGYERFRTSPVARVVHEDLFARAARAWLALPAKYRAFLARQAGLDPSCGAAHPGELSAGDRKRLHEANARIVEFAVNARSPLLDLALNEPPLPARKAA